MATISDNSRITMGLAGGLLVVCYWCGLTVGELTTRVGGVETQQASDSPKISSFAITAANHEVRISATERKLEAAKLAGK